MLVLGNALLPSTRTPAGSSPEPTIRRSRSSSSARSSWWRGSSAFTPRQRAWYGRLGLAAFVLALVAQLASAAYLATANEIPILIGLVTGVIGFLVLTIAIVRAPALPRWTGYLAFIGFVGLLIVGDGDLGIAAAGAVWLLIGWTLRTEGKPGGSPAASRA